MAPNELPSAAPGEYVPSGREAYYLPEELPPSAEFDFGSEFRETLQNAIYQLGHLEGIADETDASPIVSWT